eukprot:GHVL01044615.1.p1 GENE.GHVL01044615.1~~GHVL01044615.1.p1  ORF type:complete len:380 (+),score=87.15 GHVL01044615.1:608-1747(+)
MAAGKVRDIQVVRDQRSGRSKGVAYVEFYTQESVLKALSCTGQQVKGGTHIRVQASQAEKNRARVAAKEQERAMQEASLRLYIGGLVEGLARITEDELRDLFEPFGQVDKVQLQTDPYTRKCRGFAFVQMNKAADAQTAMQALNGFTIGEQQIQVGLAADPCNSTLQAMMAMQGVTPNAPAILPQMGTAAIPYSFSGAHQIETGPDLERLDEDPMGGMIKGANAKIALMQKLQREPPAPAFPPPPPPGMPPGMIPGMGFSTLAGTPRSGLMPAAGQISSMPATANLLLRNMFDPSTVNMSQEPTFYDDIRDDVQLECSKHGVLLDVFVRPNSIDGQVIVKFGDVSTAMRAMKALNGRWFAGKQIGASYISDAEYQAVKG